jgi:hypothetical protein
VHARARSIVVRIATKNLLAGVGVRAEGQTLKLAVHIAPDQAAALAALLRGELGLPVAGATPGTGQSADP